MSGRIYVTILTVNGIDVLAGVGDPNGFVSAPRGSLFSDKAAGQLYINTDGMTTWQLIPGGAPFPNLQIAQFSGSGILGVGTNIGMWWYNRTFGPLTITDVTMWREASGSGGTTIGDVQVDPTGTGAAFASIYLPVNRPSIPAGISPDQVQANVFLSSLVPAGAAVRFNLDTVEAGLPQNVNLQVTMV